MNGDVYTIPDFQRLSIPDLEALSSRAMALRRAAAAGTASAPLRGRNLGLMSAASCDQAAALFYRAATDLGAHVARIEPCVMSSSPSDEVRQTAHLLGRLYDGVECQGMAARLVREMSEHAGVPFFEGIATPCHPTSLLVGRLGGPQSADENRRYVVQAILLTALA